MIVNEINTNLLVAPTYKVIFTELSDGGDVMAVGVTEPEAASSSQPIPPPQSVK
jgi:hypothetical protein